MQIAIVTGASRGLGLEIARAQRQVREAAPEHFPRRERFAQLHASGDLVPPELPAREIADLLAADDLPWHCERRYQP